MKKLSVRLLLGFCSCLLLCEAVEDECTIENLPPLENQTIASSTTSFNAIITSYSFSCCGRISAWGALINRRLNRTTNIGQLNLTFQVWRPEDEEGCSYRLIKTNSFTSSQVNPNTNFTREIVGNELIEFQMNDVIGISVQRTNSTSPSVWQRNNFNPEGIMLDREVMGTSHQLKGCVNLTTSRNTLGVPIITARIEPTPCPSTTTQPPITTTDRSINSPQAGLGRGAIAGIIVAALLVLLLCVIITIVCLVLVFAKKSRKKETQQKTFGKARFIRSVYILPTLYRAAKADTKKNKTTEQNLPSTKVEGAGENEGERQTVKQKRERQGAEQGVGKEMGREMSTNSDMYINQQEFTKSTDPLTPTDDDDDDHLYENNPLARRYFRDKEEKEKEQTQETTRDYVNQAVFTQPPTLDTQLPSNGVEINEDDELYVNNLLARKKLKDLHRHKNQTQDISTVTNRAYGVTERSDDLSNLMHQGLEQQMLSQQQQSETNGEDEYVNVDTSNQDSPEEEYEDMATFQAPMFKKQRR